MRFLLFLLLKNWLIIESSAGPNHLWLYFCWNLSVLMEFSHLKLYKIFAQFWRCKFIFRQIFIKYTQILKNSDLSLLLEKNILIVLLIDSVFNSKTALNLQPTAKLYQLFNMLKLNYFCAWTHLNKEKIIFRNKGVTIHWSISKYLLNYFVIMYPITSIADLWIKLNLNCIVTDILENIVHHSNKSVYCIEINLVICIPIQNSFFVFY